MKQKTIKLHDGRELLVVELPEDYSNPHIWEGTTNVLGALWDYNGSNVTIYTFSDGDWKLLGRLPDITEEQADKVIDKSIHTGLYGHYVKDIPVNIYCYKNYAESILALLQANEVCFDNPLGVRYTKGWDAETDYRSFLNWREAQSKVWGKERTYLFIKEG